MPEASEKEHADFPCLMDNFREHMTKVEKMSAHSADKYVGILRTLFSVDGRSYAAMGSARYRTFVSRAHEYNRQVAALKRFDAFWQALRYQTRLAWQLGRRPWEQSDEVLGERASPAPRISQPRDRATQKSTEKTALVAAAVAESREGPFVLDSGED